MTPTGPEHELFTIPSDLERFDICTVAEDAERNRVPTRVAFDELTEQARVTDLKLDVLDTKFGEFTELVRGMLGGRKAEISGSGVTIGMRLEEFMGRVTNEEINQDWLMHKLQTVLRGARLREPAEAAQ